MSNPKLKDIRIIPNPNPGLASNIVLEWDNDRYQSVVMQTKDADGVITAIYRLLNLLAKDKRQGYV